MTLNTIPLAVSTEPTLKIKHVTSCTFYWRQMASHEEEGLGRWCCGFCPEELNHTSLNLPEITLPSQPKGLPTYAASGVILRSLFSMTVPPE